MEMIVSIVRIVSAKEPGYWYADSIGSVLAVYDAGRDYIVKRDYDRGHKVAWGHIDKDDCERVGPDGEGAAELLEDVAALAHEQRVGLIEYLLESGGHRSDGSLVIDERRVTGLKLERVGYGDLAESKKEPYRVEAARVLDIVFARLGA